MEGQAKRQISFKKQAGDYMGSSQLEALARYPNALILILGGDGGERHHPSFEVYRSSDVLGRRPTVIRTND